MLAQPTTMTMTVNNKSVKGWVASIHRDAKKRCSQKLCFRRTGFSKSKLPEMPMLENPAGITRARAGRDPGSLTCLSQRLVQPLARHPLAYLHRPGGPVHSVPVPCGSGLKFSLFPCVVVVSVVVPPGVTFAFSSLLPGKSWVVHTHWPRVLLQSSSGSLSAAANAERALTDRAATRKAANATIIIMRFIYSVSFTYTHPTPMKLKVHWIECEFAGAGRLVCALPSYKQAFCPLPLCLPLKLTAAAHPFHFSLSRS